MRWLNKYQKGFNRLWIVFSIVGTFAGVMNADINMNYPLNLLVGFSNLLVGFVFIFVLGHCVFFVVLFVGEWIIRGFR